MGQVGTAGSGSLVGAGWIWICPAGAAHASWVVVWEPEVPPDLPFSSQGHFLPTARPHINTAGWTGLTACEYEVAMVAGDQAASHLASQHSTHASTQPCMDICRGGARIEIGMEWGMHTQTYRVGTG